MLSRTPQCQYINMHKFISRVIHWCSRRTQLRQQRPVYTARWRSERSTATSRHCTSASDIKSLVPLYPGVGSLLDRDMKAIYLSLGRGSLVWSSHYLMLAIHFLYMIAIATCHMVTGHRVPRRAVMPLRCTSWSCHAYPARMPR